MALIKRADIENYTRDSYVMDLDDLAARGRAVINVAKGEAEHLLTQANLKRDQLIASASEEGRAVGYKEGFERGRIEGIERGTADARQEQSELMGQLSEMWSAQLDAFELQRDAMLEQARVQVVSLAAMIAERVVRRTINLDESIVLNALEAILSSVTESTRLVLAVHPDDIEIAQRELPKMVERFASCEHAQLVTDAALERGSCFARTSTGGCLDASISTQLERLIDALLPDREFDTHAGRIGEPETESEHETETPKADDEQEPKDDAA